MAPPWLDARRNRPSTHQAGTRPTSNPSGVMTSPQESSSGTRVGISLVVREAPGAESRADRELSEDQWKRVAGAVAYGEVRHPVHHLVCDDVCRNPRLFARLVDRASEVEHTGAFRAQRWHSEVGSRIGVVDHEQDPAVRAVDARPAVPSGEVIVEPAAVGMRVDHRRVVPVVVRVRPRYRQMSRPVRRAAGRRSRAHRPGALRAGC